MPLLHDNSDLSEYTSEHSISLTGLDSSKQTFAFCKANEFKPVKLETTCIAIFPPVVSDLWITLLEGLLTQIHSHVIHKYDHMFWVI